MEEWVMVIFFTFLSSVALLGLKWFYAHMKGNQEFREVIIEKTTKYSNDVTVLKDEIIRGNAEMTKMFAEELHPISAKVKRLKHGLNAVEDKVKIQRTSFDDLHNEPGR